MIYKLKKQRDAFAICAEQSADVQGDVAENWQALRAMPDLEPDATILYRLYDSEMSLLYVGIARDLQRRIEQHMHKPWWGEVASIRAEGFPDRNMALAAEFFCITELAPEHNRDQRPTFLYPARHSAWIEGDQVASLHDCWLKVEIRRGRVVIEPVLAERRDKP